MSRLNALDVSFPFVIGPMVGLSHAGFRALVRSYTPEGLAPLIFTEMLSSRRLPNEDVLRVNELRRGPGETHFVPQLLANQERPLAMSIEKLLPLDPWGFDINMGCPARNIVKHNYGVRLMEDPRAAAGLVEAAKRHTTRPVSVKLRGGTGEQESPETVLEFTRVLEEAGADWISIHARPRGQGHRGNANWDLGALVARERRIPVVINGGIQTSADAIAIVRNYEADGAMIARAAVARPWILWQIAEDLGITSKPALHPGERAPRTPEEEGREFARAALRLLDIMKTIFPDPVFIQERVAFFAATACPWFQFGHAFWKLTKKTQSLDELREKIVQFCEAEHENPMVEKITFWI